MGNGSVVAFGLYELIQLAHRARTKAARAAGKPATTNLDPTLFMRDVICDALKRRLRRSKPYKPPTDAPVFYFANPLFISDDDLPPIHTPRHRAFFHSDDSSLFASRIDTCCHTIAALALSLLNTLDASIL